MSRVGARTLEMCAGEIRPPPAGDDRAPRAGIDGLFVGGEQVQEQGAQPGVAQAGGHGAVAGASAAAAAAVREQRQSARTDGFGEITVDHDAVAGRYPDRQLDEHARHLRIATTAGSSSWGASSLAWPRFSCHSPTTVKSRGRC